MNNFESEIEKLLNIIKKPARYTGMELNSEIPSVDCGFSICLCFPDIYEVGASNLGLEILYHLINEKKLANCQRAFAPDDDLEKLLVEKKIDLFSIETRTPLKNFDMVGFTIQCELAATNIVNMLNLSGITIFSRNREEKEPLIIGGGPALTNPEPFCDFFDLFVLGDGEEAIEDIINLCKKLKNKNLLRQEMLLRLSLIEGVYVPSLYDVTYNADKTVKGISPKYCGVKAVVKKRTLNLENAYFPGRKIVPFVETVHNRLNIEVARGCPGKCRFCQASKYYRPWRQRPLTKLLELTKKGIESTGFEEVSFSSLSCSDYSNLDKLLIETNNLYRDSKLNISLPSLRCNERSLQAALYINRSKRPTLTFAPEAGTDRLRNVIGKYLSEKQIIQTLISANSLGWKVIKLYFMIGLPTETDDDIAGIAKLVQDIKKLVKLNFTVTVSPFVPKAQTPFQWSSMKKADEIEKSIRVLKKLMPANVKAHNHKSSILEAFIAKGDRRQSQVIFKAWQKGSRFEQWTDRFNYEIWESAIAESKLDLDFYVYRKIDENETLPWQHLDFGMSKEMLYADFVKGINETSEPADSGFNKASYDLPKNYEDPKIQTTPSVMRLKMRFSKTGNARFVSHLEQIEVLRRTFRRSKLPVAFSAGFSPQIKCSFGPPLSMGYESYSEFAELYFVQDMLIDEVKEKVSKALPAGFGLLDIQKVPQNFPTVDALANVVEYKIKGIEIAQKTLDEFLKQPEIIIEMIKKEKVIKLDAKPLIKELKNQNGDFNITLRIQKAKSIKPDILLAKVINSGKYGIINRIIRTKLMVEIKDNVFEL